MAEIELKSFPFDSMKVLNEESGQMEEDREYEAQIFRDYFKKILSNGVYFGHYKNYEENSMKVVLDVGLNIKVLKGAGFIEGADYENEEDRIIVLERPASGIRIDRVVVQMNASLDTRKSKIIIKQGSGEIPADLTRTENIYEICLAEVTVRSTTNLTEEDIKDTRLDKSLCGLVNSLISVEGKEIYQNFKDYIDTVVDNLVRKDQDNTIDGNLIAKTVKDVDGKVLSSNNFTNEYKSKLDGIATGATKNTSTATTSADGLMSAGDKSKLNGIANNANNYSLPKATGSTLGGVKVGSNINYDSSGAIYLTKYCVIDALGYTPPSSNTATTLANGLMSISDKAKLNGIADGATNVIVENVLTSTSWANALSAKQGKILNDKITSLTDRITSLTDRIKALESRL